MIMHSSKTADVSIGKLAQVLFLSGLFLCLFDHSLEPALFAFQYLSYINRKGSNSADCYLFQVPVIFQRRRTFDVFVIVFCMKWDVDFSNLSLVLGRWSIFSLVCFSVA